MPDLYREALGAIEEATREALLLEDTQGHLVFSQWLISLRLQYRFYFTNSFTARDLLWDQLRQDERLLDLVMRITMEFRLRFGQGDDARLTALAQALGKTMGGLTRKGGGGREVTDPAFSEHLTDSQSLTELFQHETWLITVWMLNSHLSHIQPLLAKTKVPA